METLFDIPQPKRRLSIDERFASFDAEHPEVYAHFKEVCQKLWDRGHRHYSSDGALHVVRFHRAVERDERESYLINNDYSSRYARKLMAEDSRFDGFFETRKLKGRQG